MGFQDEVMEELAAIKSEQQARLDQMEARMQRPGYSAPTTKTSAVDPQTRKAFDTYLRTGDDTELRTKLMQIGVGTDGGFTVPKELADAIAEVALLFSPMRSIADVRSVSRGTFSQIISTTAAGFEWLSENANRNDTATPQLAEITPSNGGLSAVAVITRWLLEDSEYDLQSYLIREIGKSFGVAEGDAWINGDGVNKPKGILQHPLTAQADDVRPFGTVEKVHSGTSADFDADDLIDLLFRLKAQYRANASWLVNPATLAKIRKFKGTDGQYIWQPSGILGTPSTLFGVPVLEDSFVPPPAAGSHSVIVGDFRSGYLITDIGQLALIRDEVTVKGKIKFYSEKRVGGSVLDSNAIKVLTLAV